MDVIVFADYEKLNHYYINNEIFKGDNEKNIDMFIQKKYQIVAKFINNVTKEDIAKNDEFSEYYYVINNREFIKKIFNKTNWGTKNIYIEELGIFKYMNYRYVDINLFTIDEQEKIIEIKNIIDGKCKEQIIDKKVVNKYIQFLMDIFSDCKKKNYSNKIQYYILNEMYAVIVNNHKLFENYTNFRTICMRKLDDHVRVVSEKFFNIYNPTIYKQILSNIWC